MAAKKRPGSETERHRLMIRQWRILRKLECSPKGVSVHELLQLFEDDESVVQSTLYRDLEALQAVGFPISKPEHGRYMIDWESDWKVPVMPSHILSLLYAEGFLGSMADSEMVTAFKEVKERLMACLRPQARALLELQVPTMMVTGFEPAPVMPSPEVMAALFEGYNTEQHVMLQYQARDAEEAGPRVFDIYGFWNDRGRSYIVGYCHKHQDVIPRAIQRIHDARVMEKTFTVRPDFDFAAFVKGRFRVFGGKTHKFIFDISPPFKFLVREVRFHPTQHIKHRRNGWVRVTMECSGLPELATYITSFGGGIRAVAPKALVEQVKENFRKGLEVHGEDSSEET